MCCRPILPLQWTFGLWNSNFFLLLWKSHQTAYHLFPKFIHRFILNSSYFRSRFFFLSCSRMDATKRRKTTFIFATCSDLYFLKVINDERLIELLNLYSMLLNVLPSFWGVAVYWRGRPTAALSEMQTDTICSQTPGNMHDKQSY